MTAPGRSGAEQATIRGLIVLFVAVVIGVGLLSQANGLVGSTASGAKTPKATTTTTSKTTVPSSTAVPINTGDTVPAGAHATADVRVLVVNATGGQSGVGKKNSTLLTAGGFNVVDIKNGSSIPATTVYFAAGFQADAENVKAAVKVKTALIAQAPTTPIVAGAKAADVTVVFGQDYKG